MRHQLGKRLQYLMMKLGIDETFLSTQTHVAKANISRLKNDPASNPTLATLKPLADFFGITVSQLLGEVPLEDEAFQQGNHFRIPVIGFRHIY